MKNYFLIVLLIGLLFTNTTYANTAAIADTLSKRPCKNIFVKESSEIQKFKESLSEKMAENSISKEGEGTFNKHPSLVHNAVKKSIEHLERLNKITIETLTQLNNEKNVFTEKEAENLITSHAPFLTILTRKIRNTSDENFSFDEFTTSTFDKFIGFKKRALKSLEKDGISTEYFSSDIQLKLFEWQFINVHEGKKNAIQNYKKLYSLLKENIKISDQNLHEETIHALFISRVYNISHKSIAKYVNYIKSKSQKKKASSKDVMALLDFAILNKFHTLESFRGSISVQYGFNGFVAYDRHLRDNKDAINLNSEELDTVIQDPGYLERSRLLQDRIYNPNKNSNFKYIAYFMSEPSMSKIDKLLIIGAISLPVIAILNSYL